MNHSIGCCETKLVPKFGLCDDVKLGHYTMRKTIWLVPHVIKHINSAEIISWRCNWGKVCESECLYAMANKSIQETLVTHENIKNDDGALTHNKSVDDFITNTSYDTKK